MKICLDAGHYGKYNQSPVNAAYWESDFAWKFHLLLKTELEKYGAEVITTRAEQAKDFNLVMRGKKSAGCDLFLSVHSNACGDASADYPLACCCVNGTADVIGHELCEAVAKCMGYSGKTHIWKRTGSGNSDYYGVLRGAASVGTPGVLLEHGFHTNSKNTNWLLNDSNLQKMAAVEAKVISEHFGVNATDVTAEKSETASIISGNATDATAKYIWDKLRAAGLSEAGTAGLMGNLKAESNLIATNLQNTFESKLGFTDESYTASVDAGTYGNFITDGAGYGLAQWTYYTRKGSLYSYAKSHGKSVGDLDMQLDFLLYELKGSYPDLLQMLCDTDDVRMASDAVLMQFERPADMSEAVKVKRAGFGEEFLQEFGGQAAADAAAYADALQGILEIGGKRYEVTLIEL